MTDERKNDSDTVKEPTQVYDSSKNFFISYNSADKAWAEWIAWQLEEANFSTVLQAWDFRPGANFIMKMQEASEKAERIVAVLSSSYINALYTQPEWASAFKRDPKGTKGILLPVMVQDCKQELVGIWPQIIYINFVGLDESAARRELLEGINLGRNKPITPPVFPGVIQHKEAEEPYFPGKSITEKNVITSPDPVKAPSKNELKLDPTITKKANEHNTFFTWLQHIIIPPYMHTYATDAEDKRTVPPMIAVLAVGAALLFVFVVSALKIQIPWWILAPSAMGFYGIFNSLFDGWLWKVHLGPIRFSAIPDVGGIWAGLFTSSDNDGTEVNVVVSIKQTWSLISISIEIETSTSYTTLAALYTEEALDPGLKFQYISVPEAFDNKKMHTHRGTGNLRLSSDGRRLTGEFYTGQDYQNFGILELHLVVRSLSARP